MTGPGMTSSMTMLMSRSEIRTIGVGAKDFQPISSAFGALCLRLHRQAEVYAWGPRLALMLGAGILEREGQEEGRTAAMLAKSVRRWS